MKFGQVIEHNKRNVFVQKSWRQRDRETSSRPLVFFLKETGGESKWYVAYFQYFLIVLNMICSKNVLYETLHY